MSSSKAKNNTQEQNSVHEVSLKDKQDLLAIISVVDRKSHELSSKLVADTISGKLFGILKALLDDTGSETGDELVEKLQNPTARNNIKQFFWK